VPRLAGLRLESIGHRDARFEGLVIGFTDPHGAPCDSVLWLRNGGGKSSILNLLFSLLRPHQREFLGSEAEARVRELDDYLFPDDTGSVCLSWRLDPDPSGAEPELLTGVCMEPARSGEAARLRRLFYAIRIDDPAAAPVSLATLPLVSGANGGRRLARLTTLRDALRALDGQRGVRVQIVEVQRDWEDVLDSYGLDPEVFGYQIRMNRREGAADELFRFGSDEEFVDFLLEMAFSDAEAALVSRNLRELRSQVQRRPRLVEEREALERLREVLRPHALLAEERRRQRGELAALTAAGRALCARVAAARDARASAAARARAEQAEQDERYRSSSRERNRRAWALVAYRKRRADLEVVAKEGALAAARAEVGRREREQRLLGAAHVLQDLLAQQAKAGALRRELRARLEEHRPLEEALAGAAAALCEALEAELAALAARAELLGARRREAEARADDARQRERAAAARLAALAARLDRARADLRRMEERRAALEAEGALGGGETATAAAARLEATLAALDREDEEDAATAERAEQAARDREPRAAAAGQAAAAAEAQAGAVAEAVAAARRELHALEADPVLAQTLEDSQPDLLGLGREAVRRLEGRARRVSEQLVLARIEQEVEARALAALEQDDLLPPTVDAEVVQRTLRAAGVTAFGGGAYLADNARGARAEALLRAHPELGAGVVVAESDWPHAREVLAAAPPEVQAPVAVGTTAGLLAEGEPQLVALPPRAYFDHTASVAERERRTAAEARRRASLESLSREKLALDSLGARVEALLGRSDAAWFAERATEEHGLRARAASMRVEEVELRRQLDALRAEVTALRQRAKGRGERRRAAARLRERVQRFLEDGGDRLGDRRAEIAELAADGAETEAARRSAAAELPAIAEEQRRLEGDAVELSVARRALEEEHAEAAAAAGGRSASEARPMDLAVAREVYRTRAREFERATGNQELTGRIAEVDHRVADHTRELDAQLRRAGGTRAEAEEVLGLADAVGLGEHARRVESGLADARRRAEAAGAALALARDQARRAEKEAAEVRRQGHGKVVADELERVAAAPADEVDRLIEQAEREMAELQGAESDADRLRAEAQARAAAAAADEAALGGLAERLQDALGAAPAPAAPVAGDADVDVPAFRARVDEVLPALRALDEAVRDLDRRGQDAGRAIAACATRAENAVLPGSLRTRLCEPDLEVLLARIGDHLTDVDLRVTALGEELAQVDSFRKLMAASLQRATDPALRLLHGLERASRFPAGEAVWGGQPFVKVDLRIPPTAAERETVAATLIDRMVQQADVPGGLRLVQLFVRELTRGGGLSVRIVKPEVFRRLHYEPVERLRAFSRGEQLTSAILLYCTLARLRAQERGRRRSSTSVLILDNPLGTCSKPEFVELQRNMARAHGVQLIYTTGIEDLEALALLPNIIRLRNAHQDRRGRMHVTAEAGGPAPVRAVRIAREE
jgi:hypothetical protein